MILTCEDCHTRYLLPTHLLGNDGRQVRCTICSHEWFQIPEDDDGIDIELPEPADESPSFAETLSQVEFVDSVNEEIPDDRMLASDLIPAEKKKRSFRLQPGLQPGMGKGLVAAGLLGVVICALLIILREPVMGVWPNSMALYQAIGLQDPVPGEGLVFEDLKATTSYNAQGVEILRLTGTIRNLRNYPVRVPGLRFALRRADNSEVETWLYPSPNADMPPHGAIPLNATYPQIAADVKLLNVRFIAE